MADKLADYQGTLTQRYNHLMGKKLVPDETEPVAGDSFRAKDVEGRVDGGGWVRVVTPGKAITKDLRGERLNVHVGDDGVVHEFKFY